MDLRRRLLVVAALIFLSLTHRAVAGVGIWTPLGPEGGSVWSLAVDPDDADVVYAGTRSGVFKSTDAGATWTSASKGLGPAGVWVMSLAVTPDAVYAGTYTNGVYKSTDGGASWFSASAGLPSAVVLTPNVGALVADPRSPSRIWAGTNRGVFLTTNGGLSWQERRRGLPLDSPSRGLVLAPDGKTLYVSNSRSVFKTTNQGKRWERVGKGLIGGVGDMVLDPANPAIVYAGGLGLWKSLNGGASWIRVAPTLFDGGILALTRQGTRLFVSHESNTKHGIWYSDDRGVTWTPAEERPSDPAILDLAAGPDLVYAGTASNIVAAGVYRSVDRGRTWDLSITGLIALGARGVTVDPTNSDVLYTGIDDVGLFKSLDRGATWEPLDIGLEPLRQIRISTILVERSNSSIVYAGSGFGAGGLYRTTDAGASWEKSDDVGQLMPEALVPDPRTPGAVWAAGAPGLYHSDDQGETWTQVPMPGGSPGDDLWLRAFQVDRLHQDVLWAAGTLIEIRPGGIRLLLRLFRSADAGQTWERRETGLTGDSVLSLAVDPANSDLLLAGTETGLFRTTNAGLTWTKVPGFAATVNAIVAAPTTPTAFYANLDGFGVQRSIDGGVTWTPARRGLAPVPVSSLTVDPNDPRLLYAGSLTRGVFTYTEP
jgi:photosystem II stability/assembly factor-like uncharacterized protein